jgi:hypothetical protein
MYGWVASVHSEDGDGWGRGDIGLDGFIHGDFLPDVTVFPEVRVDLLLSLSKVAVIGPKAATFVFVHGDSPQPPNPVGIRFFLQSIK